MSDWSTNITEAQTGDYVWLALPCGRVIKSFWRNAPWSSFHSVAPGTIPVAWQAYAEPIHPFELAKQEESASC